MSRRSRPNSNPPIRPKAVRLDWKLISDPVRLTGKEIIWSGEPHGGDWHSEEQALLLVLSERQYCVIDTDVGELLRYESPDGTPRLDELLPPRILHEIGVISERQREQMEGIEREEKRRRLIIDVERCKRLLAQAEKDLANAGDAP